MPKVSVIVPVYNAAAYIERCMQSVFAQTLTDIELVLVDDHGTDESMAVAQRVAQQANIPVIFTETSQNAGPGAARNVGIQKATSEYVAFLDADDWVEPTMYESLYQSACKFSADISSSAAVLDYADGRHKCMKNPYVGSGILTVEQRKYILKRFVSNFTTMIFRRDWLLQECLLFPTEKSGEDSCFMAQCYLLANHIAQCNEPYYHYVIHAESISHKKGVYRGAQKRRAFKALIDFAKERGLLAQYRIELYIIYFKKAIVTSIVDFIKSL